MKTVADFYDMVMLNEYHNIRVKSGFLDEIIAEFDNAEGLEESGCSDCVITAFATDWENKIYILWV